MGLLVEDLLTLARLDQQRPLAKAPVDLLTLAADAVQDARIVAPGRPVDLGGGAGGGVHRGRRRAPAAAGDREPDEQRAHAHPAGHAGAGEDRPRHAGGDAARRAGERSRTRRTAGPARTRTRVRRRGSWRGRRVPAVVLDVEDDGPGMSADQAQRVFERFYRADQARNRASGGTGLGLAIVAGLVAAHGGTVSVRTAPGQGADFQVRLPLSPDALPGEEPDEDSTCPALTPRPGAGRTRRAMPVSSMVRTRAKSAPGRRSTGRARPGRPGPRPRRRA